MKIIFDTEKDEELVRTEDELGIKRILYRNSNNYFYLYVEEIDEPVNAEIKQLDTFEAVKWTISLQEPFFDSGKSRYENTRELYEYLVEKIGKMLH